MNEIEEFIFRRFPSATEENNHWLDGNCLWFAIILTKRFPKLHIYYFSTVGHFVAGKDNKGTIEYYDATGRVYPNQSENVLELNQIRKTDQMWFRRLIRDCFK